MRLTRPPRNRRSPPNNRRWRNSPHRKLSNSSPPNSSRSRCTLRSRRRNSRETAAFKPIFEPGSVFDRVSKGGLAKQEQTIEVDGLTSDDAKRTDDFTVQFQMARHPELLPFLAMNPSLYDDLYAWLGALGNQDIDAALAHNPGYEEYRKAVGK